MKNVNKHLNFMNIKDIANAQPPMNLNYGLTVSELVSFGGGLLSDVIF